MGRKRNKSTIISYKRYAWSFISNHAPLDGIAKYIKRHYALKTCVMKSSTNAIKKGMWMNTTALLKHIKNIKEVALDTTFPMKDTYGKKSDVTVMKLNFTTN